MDGFSVLVDEKVIHSNLKIIYKDGSSSLINMNGMTSLLIGKSDNIYFYEQIDIAKIGFITAYLRNGHILDISKIRFFLLNKAFKEIN